MTDCEEYIEFCSDLRETEGAAWSNRYYNPI